MLLLSTLAITLALAPSLASAAIFPKDSHVKLLDPKGFKKIMKRNDTSVVAFVAPWCGHCQKMAPEYSKAAKSLHPLVPLYAVDCDEESNKRLCAEQEIKGFPTVKIFPRGNQKPSKTYDSGARTAPELFRWASYNVPDAVKKLKASAEITSWIDKQSSKPRALLLSKDKKVPLLWTVLSNKYGKDIQFGSHADVKGKFSSSLGLKIDEKKSSTVVIYPAGSTEPVLYEGLTKYEALTKFFKSVLDGTADLKFAEKKSKAEEPEIKTEEKKKSAEPVIPATTQARKPAKTETKAKSPVESAGQVVLEAVKEAYEAASSVVAETTSSPAGSASTATPSHSSEPVADKADEEHPKDEL